MEEIPRFILQLTDTKTTIKGSNGEEYLTVSIGSDKLSDFNKPIPKAKRQNSGTTEFQAMLLFFAEQTAKADIERTGDEVVGYTKVKK